MLKTKKRGHAQLEDSLDDEENSGDDLPSDGDTDGSPLTLGLESTRGDLHIPKKTKRVSRSKYQPC